VSLASRGGSEKIPRLFVTPRRHFIGGKTNGGASTRKTGEGGGFVLLNCVPLAFYLLLTGSRLLAVADISPRGRIIEL